MFYDRRWKKLGDRRQLAARINEGTGIYTGLLARRVVGEGENLRALRRDLVSTVHCGSCCSLGIEHDG
jgi:hypothetical protein